MEILRVTIKNELPGRGASFGKSPKTPPMPSVRFIYAIPLNPYLLLL
jgi:hypothetical protein